MKNSILNTVKSYIIPIIIGLGIAFLLAQLVVPVRVVGESMQPTYDNGDLLIAKKVANDYEYGDVIVFDSQDAGKQLIKRVIAVAGDEILINEDGVFVNGEKLVEDYIKEEMIVNEVIEMTVEDGHIFVCGDNRNDSLDSRALGTIPTEEVIAKIMFAK